MRQIRTESSSEIPTHIKGVLDDIRINVPPDMRDEAVPLITKYSDLFAVSDLDLGDLTVIEHHIETGEAQPIKQRIRRTPVVFQGEEEGHLDRILSVGVIHPFTLDWAAAPVLIRKGGSVRWCVDYRAL